MATPRPPGELSSERLLRKARDIRTAFLQSGLVVSPDRYMSLDELPPERQEKWLKMARYYVEVFG